MPSPASPAPIISVRISPAGLTGRDPSRTIRTMNRRPPTSAIVAAQSIIRIVSRTGKSRLSAFAECSARTTYTLTRIMAVEMWLALNVSTRSCTLTYCHHPAYSRKYPNTISFTTHTKTSSSKKAFQTLAGTPTSLGRTISVSGIGATAGGI